MACEAMSEQHGPVRLRKGIQVEPVLTFSHSLQHGQSANRIWVSASMRGHAIRADAKPLKMNDRRV